MKNWPFYLNNLTLDLKWVTCGLGNIYFEKNILGRGTKKNVERREISKGGLLGGWVRGEMKLGN